MKKLILTGLLVLSVLSAKAELIATNLTTTGAGGNTFLLLSDRASVYSVEISASVAGLVRLYDQSTVAAPYYGTNYVTAEYTGRSSYATNIVSTYVGFNGMTNRYTNSGIFTYETTVAAATNALNPSAAFSVAAGTYAVYSTDALFTRGIAVHSTTNVSIVINYRPAR